MSLRWSSDDGISQLLSDGTTEACSPEMFFQQETKSNEKGENIITSSELENRHRRAVALLNALRDELSEATPVHPVLRTQGCGELCWDGVTAQAPNGCTQLPESLARASTCPGTAAGLGNPSESCFPARAKIRAERGVSFSPRSALQAITSHAPWYMSVSQREGWCWCRTPRC